MPPRKAALRATGATGECAFEINCAIGRGRAIIVTALHYTDNYLAIEEYPQPEWIHRETIYIAWSLLTLVGIAGYMLFRDGRLLAAGLYLLVYSYTGTSSLGHYPYGSAGDFTTKMHLFIWTDALVGFLVAGCALWILLARRSDVKPERSFD